MAYLFSSVKCTYFCNSHCSLGHGEKDAFVFGKTTLSFYIIVYVPWNVLEINKPSFFPKKDFELVIKFEQEKAFL